jgi:hypothetical protein
MQASKSKNAGKRMSKNAGKRHPVVTAVSQSAQTMLLLFYPPLRIYFASLWHTH